MSERTARATEGAEALRDEVGTGEVLEEVVARALPGADAGAAVIALQAMRLGRLMERNLQALLAPHGLERSELSVLALLLLVDEPEGTSPTELARGVVITTSGMTKALRRLERGELVQLSPDPRDGRAVVVRLAPAGRARAADLLQQLAAHFDMALDGVDEPARRSLIASMRTLLGPFETDAGVAHT
jgi:DNA-binding MarR family transcriptional regulator